MPKERQRRAGVTVLFVLLNLQHSWTNNKSPKLKSCNGTSKQPPPNKTSKQIPNQPTHFHKFVQGKVCSSWFLWRWCYCKATVLHKKLAASFLLYLLCLFCIIFSLLWWQMTDTVLSMTFMPAPCCLSFFYLFGAALAAVQLLTWSCSAGVSPGLLGGFGAGKSVCSCCPGAAWRGSLRSIKWDVYGQMDAENLNEWEGIAGARTVLTLNFPKVLRSQTLQSLMSLTNCSGRTGCWKMSCSYNCKNGSATWVLHQ